MIVLGAVLPHPPILLPQIAQGRETHVQATLNAYKTITVRFQELDVQRLLLISTHGIVTLNRFHTLGADLSGNFERFGHPGLTFEHSVDQEMAQRLVDAAGSANLPLTQTTIWEQSDHSLGVPITLLGDALPPTIGVVSISFRPPVDHYRLGQRSRPRCARRANRDHRLRRRSTPAQRRLAPRQTSPGRGSPADLRNRPLRLGSQDADRPGRIAPSRS